MPAIERTIDVAAAPEELFEAVATQAGIAGWWSVDSTVGDRVGSPVSLTFHKDGQTIPMGFEIEQRDEQAVRWRCTDNGNPTWVGTTISWRFTPSSVGTSVEFAHAGWSDDGPAPEVVQGWDHFMGSLKSYAETGTGSPFA